MFARFQLQFVLLLTVAIFSGCTPQFRREKTEVKSASDVVIHFDDLSSSNNSEETPDEAATPATTPTAGNESTTATTPKKEMVAATTTSKPDVAKQAPTTTGYTGPAKFVGRVVVKGDVPLFSALLAKGAATKDMFCSEMAVPNETVISKDGGLGNVFVYMKKAPRKGVPEYSGEPFVVNQKGCIFIPHAQIVRVGQPFILKNSDPVAHNVRYNGFASQFNDTVVSGSTDGLTKVIEFPERLPAGMVCDFHNWMSAYVLPVDHPWAAVTDADGNFEITNLPEGKWDFVIWHEKALYIERSFKVTAAPNTLIEKVFEVNASKLSQ